MIYNTINRSNDTTESQKERKKERKKRPVLILIFSTLCQKSRN